MRLRIEEQTDNYNIDFSNLNLSTTEIYVEFVKYLKSFFSFDFEHQEVHPGISKQQFVGLWKYFLPPAFIIDNPKKITNFSEILNTLDNTQNGRDSYQLINIVSSGHQSFFTDTGSHAEKHRKTHIRYFSNPLQFFSLSQSIVKNILDVQESKGKNVKDIVNTIVYSVFAKHFFNLDNLSSNDVRILSKFTYYTLHQEKFTLFPKLSLFSAEYRNIKQQFGEFVDNLLKNQATLILKRLQSFTPNNKHQLENLFADSIFELTKEQNPNWDEETIHQYFMNMNVNELAIKYFSNKYIKTIPAIFAAGENIILVIVNALKEIAANKELQTELRLAYSKNQNVNNRDFNDYYEACLEEAEVFLSRYTNQDINFVMEDKTYFSIPAHSYLSFNLSQQENQYQNLIFSHSKHKRKCPGIHATEYIFKGILMGIISSYEISLSKGNFITLIPIEKIELQINFPYK